uniref:Uncharacterized protein n=1 Tax=viral metagenome TaxID=1070528 RepID=A0A6C0KWL9_9ZZZZ
MIEDLNKFEEYLQNVSIFKTIFICSVEKQDEIYEYLMKSDYTVVSIKDELNDINHIMDFENSNYRIILFNILYWDLNKSTIQKYILPYQNLLVLLDISEFQNNLIKSWISLSNKNGFINSSLNPAILDLDDN